jgi:hypothetical protein
MREVRADEVRAICEAGGEVTDGHGDVWMCHSDHRVGFGYFSNGEFFPVSGAAYRQMRGHAYLVTKEPPAKTEPTSFATKLEALVWMAQNPGRRVRESRDGYEFAVADDGALHDFWGDGPVTEYWNDAAVPFTVIPPDPPKPATDEELIAYIESLHASTHFKHIIQAIRTRRLP